VVSFSFVASPSVLWYCWLGLYSCKHLKREIRVDLRSKDQDLKRCVLEHKVYGGNCQVCDTYFTKLCSVCSRIFFNKMTFYKVLKCCDTSLSFSQTQQYRPALRWQVFYLIVRPTSLPDSLLIGSANGPCWGGGRSTDPRYIRPYTSNKKCRFRPTLFLR